MAKTPNARKRNPEAPHVKAYADYRKRTMKPRAKLVFSRSDAELTRNRFDELIKGYNDSCVARWEKQIRMSDVNADRLRASAEKLFMFSPERRELEDKYDKMRKKWGLITPYEAQRGYPIVKAIIEDFTRRDGKRAPGQTTKGVSVFGFGAGYAQLLFFLKNYMGARVKGVDLKDYAKAFTRLKKLGVEHSRDAADPELRKRGKFDVTYSVAMLETDVVDKHKALQILDNVAAMTRKGGKSYHYVLYKEDFPFYARELEERGFRIDFQGPLDKYNQGVFLRLTKVRD